MVARMTLGLCALALFAGTAMATETSSRKPSTKEPDKVACRYIFLSSSHVRRSRICRTNREWTEMRKMRRQSEESIDHIPLGFASGK